MKKILIINGHPDPLSFCTGIQNAYKRIVVNKGYEVKVVAMSEMKFDPNLARGYRERMNWEPDLLDAWEAITWAEHIVWIYPTWWGMMPAIMKGFIDRMFLPGMAFKYDDEKMFPVKLLKGKTSEIISTMDTPVWYYRWILGNPGGKMLQRCVCSLCGIRNIRTSYFATIKKSDPEIRDGWMQRVQRLASRA